MSLTDLAIRKLKPDPTKRIEVPDGDGLFLILQPSGHRSWGLRYRHAGRPRKLTLGRYPALSLEEARKRARKATTAIDEGRDPAREKRDTQSAKAKAVANRFELVVERFMAECLKEPQDLTEGRQEPTRHQAETRRLLDKLVTPKWKDIPLTEITKANCKDLLRTIAKATPVQANRTWAALSKFFNWAIEEEMLTTSPMFRVRRPAEETSRERVLSDSEIVRLWRACDALDSREAAFVWLALLTAARRSELLGMMWDEIDMEAGTWTMAGSRTKNNVSHVLPLVDEARSILAGLPRIAAPGKTEAKFVLTLSGFRPLGNLSKTKKSIDEAVAADGGPEMNSWVFHDLRRTSASGLAKLGTPPHVIEAVLNHSSGAKAGVAGIYNRYRYDAEKRIALTAWASHLAAILDGRPAANVVPISRAG